jgi:hypothetical protein
MKTFWIVTIEDKDGEWFYAGGGTWSREYPDALRMSKTRAQKMAAKVGARFRPENEQ